MLGVSSLPRDTGARRVARLLALGAGLGQHAVAFIAPCLAHPGDLLDSRAPLRVAPRPVLLLEEIQLSSRLGMDLRLAACVLSRQPRRRARGAGCRLPDCRTTFVLGNLEDALVVFPPDGRGRRQRRGRRCRRHDRCVSIRRHHGFVVRLATYRPWTADAIWDFGDFVVWFDAQGGTRPEDRLQPMAAGAMLTRPS